MIFIGIKKLINLKQYFMSIIRLKKIKKKITTNLYTALFKIKLYNFNSIKNKLSNIESIFTFAKMNFDNPIPFWQIKMEICSFISLIKDRNAVNILEIGTAGGGSLFMLSQVCSSDAVIISIDLPYGKFGGGYPEERIPIYKALARSKQKIELIREDSHSIETFRKVSQIIDNQKLDLIFIDGDHSYEGVKGDFELYSKLLDKNGIIAFHDIVNGTIENVGGVPKFWIEIKDKYKHIEFVENWNQGGFGIGVLFL